MTTKIDLVQMPRTKTQVKADSAGGGGDSLHVHHTITPKFDGDADTLPPRFMFYTCCN